MYDLSQVNERKNLVAKDDILSHVSDYQIFSYYIEDFKVGRIICSPLRTDKNPSWKVYKGRNGKLYFIDHSSHEYGDCFDFVMKLYNLSFAECLEKVAYDMGVSKTKPSFSNVKNKGKRVSHVDTPVSYSEIGVNKGSYTKEDLAYWASYGIDLGMLNKYRVVKCDRVFLNGRVFWVSTSDNPVFAYVFYKDGRYTMKIYRPKAKKGERWLSNTNRTILQGWDQLPERAQTLIITKSLKDVMVLNSFGYPSLAMQNEVSSIKYTVVEELYSRFDEIYILQDFDYAGVTGVNKLRKAFDFKYFFIQSFSTRNNGLKDISDYRQSEGYYKAKQLIDSYINEAG
jgi:hypothetical protein